jgi:hypothetical protein
MREGVFNMQNSHLWERGNSHSNVELIKAGIVGDIVIGPNWLTGLPEDVPLAMLSA